MANRRSYEKKEIKPRWRYEGRLYPGLKKVHIGEDVWLIGRPKRIKDGRDHQVIYGPDNKEYHLYNDDIKHLNTPPDSDRENGYKYHYETNPGESYCNRHGNRAIESKVKIYILTNILDARENWCFDLNVKPITGSKVKIIYDNGTVKIVDYFSGEFEKAELISKKHVYKFEERNYSTGKIEKAERLYQTFVNPVAYRLQVAK
jgi:hypothetical protein